MNPTALRSALAAALDALDAPDPEPAYDIADVIEAEADAHAERVAVEVEADAARTEAAAAAEVAIIEAEAAAEVEVIAAEAAAEVAVIEAAAELVDDAAPDDDAEVLDCPDDLDLGSLLDDLGELVDDGADALDDVLDGPEDDAPLDIEDVAPAATHWYTRKRRFISR